MYPGVHLYKPIYQQYLKSINPVVNRQDFCDKNYFYIIYVTKKWHKYKTLVSDSNQNAYNIFHIIIKPHSKFEMNPSIESGNNCEKDMDEPLDRPWPGNYNIPSTH